MGLEFSTIRNETPGVVASPLKRSYAALAASEPSLWRGEQARWDQHGRDVFQQIETVGASVFLTRFDGSIVGFAWWDPRQRPQRGIVEHNCILPECRGRGFGRHGGRIESSSSMVHPVSVGGPLQSYGAILIFAR